MTARGGCQEATMKVHRQTHRRRVSDNDVRAILRGQMRTGRRTDAATIRGLGIACGSCRLSRLRREVKRELAEGGPVFQVALGSANHPPAALSVAIVPLRASTGGEAVASDVPTAPVSQSGEILAAGSNRPAHVGEPRRVAPVPQVGYVRELFGRILCAAAEFRAALGRRLLSPRKAPSPRRRSGMPG
jgi:hypothetical protein